jgi:predicted nuclease of restriction endonuclease-like (RecB) superfamily
MDVLTKANVMDEAGFAEVVGLIAAAQQRAFQAVNTTLIDLYWQVGEYISRKIESAEWGDGVVPQLAQYIARTQPGQRGFTTRNLFRMKQFYEAYPDESIVSAVLTQLPWTHHLIIIGQSKRPEEREFYLRMAARERWSSRELERQFKAALFERVVLSPPKMSPALPQSHPDAQNVFKDAYALEFLGLPQEHSENDLHHA